MLLVCTFSPPFPSWGPWESYLTYESLSFIICGIGDNDAVIHRFIVKLSWTNASEALRTELGAGNGEQPHDILCILQCSITNVGWLDEWVNQQIIQALLLWPDDLWEPNSQSQGVSYKKLSHNQLLMIRVFLTDVSSATRIFSCFLELPVTSWESIDLSFVTSWVSATWSLVQRGINGEVHGSDDFHLSFIVLVVENFFFTVNG